MKCLGIDVGTSSIKGAVLDLEDCTVGEVIKEGFSRANSGPASGTL